MHAELKPYIFAHAAATKGTRRRINTPLDYSNLCLHLTENGRVYRWSWLRLYLERVEDMMLSWLLLIVSQSKSFLCQRQQMHAIATMVLVKASSVIAMGGSSHFFGKSSSTYVRCD